MAFPFCHQLDAMDCGPACLKMITEFYGRNYSLQNLRKWCFTNRNGVTMLGIVEAAENIGFRTMGIRTTFEKLKEKVVLPCIIHWRQDHFIVVYKIKVSRHKGKYKGKVYVADPAFGLVTYTVEEFLDGWTTMKYGGEEKGMVLMLSPSVNFYKNNFQEEDKSIKNISWFINYLTPYKKYLFQIVLAFIFGLIVQMIFPFLTQSMIDVGVLNNNMNFIILILVAQLIISISQLAVRYIQNWLFLHMSTRINVSLISDFLAKLLRLPVNFFDSKKQEILCRE